MAAITRGALAKEMRAAVAADGDLPRLAQAVYAAVGRHVPFDFACFATTDPATGLITWASKTRSLGVGDEEFAAAEYGPPDINNFADLARRSPPAGVLSIDTGGRPEACRRHREFMSPRFGFTDELRVVFRSRRASWGVLALYRGKNDPPFTAADAAQLGALSELAADAIQRILFRHEDRLRNGRPAPSAAVTDGPAVLIIDAADRVTQLTPAARSAIEEFGGWEHGSLPANVLAVVASARTRSTPTDTRVQGRSGHWLSLRAAPLAGSPVAATSWSPSTPPHGGP